MLGISRDIMAEANEWRVVGHIYCFQLWKWDEDQWFVENQPDDLWIFLVQQFLVTLSHLPARLCCWETLFDPCLSSRPRSLSLLNDFLVRSIHGWLCTRQMLLKWWQVVNLGNWTASCQLSWWTWISCAFRRPGKTRKFRKIPHSYLTSSHEVCFDVATTF